MSDTLFYEALQTIQQKLSKPRDLIIHTLLFSFVAPITAILNTLPYVANQIDGKVYWGIFFWCLALVGHGVFSYLRSGAWKSHREQTIRYTLLEMAHTYDLSTEELVELHQQLDDEVRRRAAIIRKPMAGIIGHSLLWQGMLLLMLPLSRNEAYAEMTLSLIQTMPVIGSLLIGMVLAVVLGLGLFKREGAVRRDDHLHALYASKVEKRKRNSTERLMIDDEGEIVLDDELAIQRKRG